MKCPEDKSFVCISCQEFSFDAIHVKTGKVYTAGFTVIFLLNVRNSQLICWFVIIDIKKNITLNMRLSHYVQPPFYFLLCVDEEKLDDRAKLSVAAKRLLFRVSIAFSK